MKHFLKACMKPTPRRLLVFLFSFISIAALAVFAHLPEGVLTILAGLASVQIGQSMYKDLKLSGAEWDLRRTREDQQED